MSKRAEEAALEAYPRCAVYNDLAMEYNDINKCHRIGFEVGYEQAEKNIVSIIESRLAELLGDAQPTPILRYELRDLIKKINEEEK